MAFLEASRRSVSFPRGTMVTYVTWDVLWTCHNAVRLCWIWQHTCSLCKSAGQSCSYSIYKEGVYIEVLKAQHQKNCFNCQGQIEGGKTVTRKENYDFWLNNPWCKTAKWQNALWHFAAHISPEDAKQRFSVSSVHICVKLWTPKCIHISIISIIFFQDKILNIYISSQPVTAF